MNKLLKLTSLICTFAFVFFCFSGCDLSFRLPGGSETNPYMGKYGDSSIGNNGGSNTKTFEELLAEHTADVHVTYADQQDLLMDQAENLGINGVRTLSVPVAGAQSGFTQTDAERARFYSNVIEQYEVVAKYILTDLVGHFGMGNTDSSVVSNAGHTFYIADTRTVGDYSIAIEPSQPTDRSATTFAYDSNYRTIDRCLVGWEIDSSHPETPTGTVLSGFKCDTSRHSPTAVYSTAYAWTLNIVDESASTAADYLEAYLDKYLTFVTMRIMEIDYELAATPYSSFNQSTAKEKIWNYVVNKGVNRLGTSLSIRKNVIMNMFKNEVIGSDALSHDNNSKTFAEPSFVADYTYETGETDPDTGAPITNTVQITHFADINGNGVYDASFSVGTSAGFYCDFEGVLGNAVDACLVAAADFPTYYAIEVTDFTTEQFFDIGEEVAEGQVQVLANLPVAEYQSAVILMDKKWNFNTFYIGVSADTEFVLTTYLRIVINGNEFITKIACINVDPTKDWGFEGEDSGSEERKPLQDMTEEEYIEYETENMFNTELKRNFILIDLSIFIDETTLAVLNAFGQNSDALQETEYETSENRRGYHTNSVDNTDFSPTEDDDGLYTFGEIEENHEHIMFNKENGNFVELLFETNDTTQAHPFTFIAWGELEGGESDDENEGE